LFDRRGQLTGIARAAAIPAPALLVECALPPQNVGYAVPPQTVARFLDDHGIGHGQAQGERAAPDIAADVMRSVVEVICHRPRQPTAATPNLTRTAL